MLEEGKKMVHLTTREESRSRNNLREELISPSSFVEI
jgi:hypothetical protein